MQATIHTGRDGKAGAAPWPVARRVFPDGASTCRRGLAGAGGALLLAAAVLLWVR
jgi:hypothetical protein